ncbi:MAG: hypothetical protein IPK94_05675 [Saprospiraceae bacterium]|nr:hypothetical protein [Saprospiraceae bacterium]MBK8513824.1 hypothetical protein [Saprospiraceae bacterium]
MPRPVLSCRPEPLIATKPAARSSLLSCPSLEVKMISLPVVPSTVTLPICSSSLPELFGLCTPG